MSSPPLMPPLDSCFADLLAQVTEQSDGFFVILDPVDEPRLIDKIQSLKPSETVPLWNENAARDYWAISPFMAKLTPSLLTWLAQELSDHPWGIVCQATTELMELRAHFRRFLLVESPEGKTLYFRFYDPRVLENYLKIITPHERKLFFGPTSQFWIPHSNAPWSNHLP